MTLVDMSAPHIPVLAGELIELLDPAPGETALDCTFGAGGHARLVAERIGQAGTLIAVDRDPAAAGHFQELEHEVECSTRFIGADFVTGLTELAAERQQLDMIYLDLGMSSMQVDTLVRGFSYACDAPLDMRMDPAQELTAASILATYDERQLTRLFRNYGEERYARQIARSIVKARERTPLRSTSELVDVIKAAIPAPARFAAGHPAKRVFQALRIAVNDELGQLDNALPLAWDLLRPGGRLAVISFHSLEDRRVKQFLAEKARGCICPPEFPVCVCGHTAEAELLTRRAVAPSAGEVATNPRSKSAHLRVARKLEAEA
jgi:16S rRNA (cytosine1402-N4)-methyltransferase